MKAKRRRDRPRPSNARKLLDTGRVDAALAAAAEACRRNPADTEAWFVQAAVHAQRQDYRRVIDCCRAVIAVEPGNAVAHFNLALAYNAQGETARAREELLEATRAHPDYAQAWSELGRFELRVEHYAEAAQHYERAARLSPTLENRCNLAHCLYAADRVEPARRLYHELLAQAPDNPLIHNNLGRLYERIGQPDPAERHFRRAIELQPGQSIPHCNLGRVLLGRGQHAAARVEYEQAIAADAGYFEGHFGRGQALCELGEQQEAIESFNAAIRLKPDLADAKYYIASLGGEASEADKQEYVAGLFDKYAEKFDNELVNSLKYKTPQYLFDAVTSALPLQLESLDVLDLGCGTGLCAPLFRPLAGRLVGVDLSGKMIDKARERNLYDDLAVADVTAFMGRHPRAYDLIVAADVFVYLGDLSATFQAAHTALRAAGYFAFSTETGGSESFKIQGSGRHAHAKPYIRQLADASGFTLISDTDCELRLEYGRPVAGTVYVLTAGSDAPAHSDL